MKKVRGQLVGFVGLSPQLVPLPDEYRTLLQYGPLQALWHGVQKTWSLITLTFDMIGKLIGGIVSLDNLSGPISIAKGPAAAPITGWSISWGSWRSSASTWGSSICSPCRFSMVATWSISSSRRSPASRYRKNSGSWVQDRRRHSDVTDGHCAV